MHADFVEHEEELRIDRGLNQDESERFKDLRGVLAMIYESACFQILWSTRRSFGSIAFEDGRERFRDLLGGDFCFERKYQYRMRDLRYLSPTVLGTLPPCLSAYHHARAREGF